MIEVLSARSASKAALDREVVRPSVHRRFRELVDEIEGHCDTAHWRAGDIDLWPIVSQDLFLDMFRGEGCETAAEPQPLLQRAAVALALPAINLWRSRYDLKHWVARPHPADVILLGDGVSLDCVDGAWRDRFGEPIMRAVERRGQTCFLMQSGNLARLPWGRRTFPANVVAAKAAMRAAFSKGPLLDLPGYASVMAMIAQAGVDAPSLSPDKIAKRARTVAAQAAQFDRILRRVRPAKAFVVGYYAGLGHAFVLACRRLGILCVDIQHCPYDAQHRAYRWSSLPEHGFSTVPSLFWTWTEEGAANVRRWTASIDHKWHDAISGGHTQISAMVGRPLAASEGKKFDREILVTLQPIGGKRHVWSALAEEIQSSPATWRWWIRRHPASTVCQDAEYAELLNLDRVIAGEASQVPLPQLLARMDAQVSLASGAAFEAAMFGVPAFFLDDEARDTFPRLLERGDATVVDVRSVVATIDRLSPRTVCHWPTQDDLQATLDQIDRLARDYAALCAEMGGD